MRRFFSPTRMAWACALLLPAFPAALYADTPPPLDPADAHARALAENTPLFKTFVFTGEPFPECTAGPEDLLGPSTLKTTFYDPAYRVLAAAKDAGPYGVVVEVAPKTGAPPRRFLTLYRVAEKPAGDLRFDPAAPEAFAKALALDAAAVRREQALIADVLKSRPFEDWSHDARAARLLAGLSRDKAGDEPPHKYDDAFALDRQWWVGLKRRLHGWDKEFTKPFTGPRPKEGAPAPAVHEGTAAEAGVKDDTADKIDAACKEWAADTDQAFAVCVVRHGVIVIHKAYGTRDGKPMTVDTKSWMASITKTMSASLMMQLVDQGLVDLDDPVDKYLPPLRGIKVETPLTIRHLYTHTNGLDKWPGWSDELPDVEERVAAYYDRLHVGKTWAYNGGGYTLGGKIIEAVSGEAVPQFFHKHLLAPLGDEHTDVSATHADAYSTPLDVARFGQMLLNRGAYGKLRFFGEETFDKMLPRKLTKVLGPDATKVFGIGLDGNEKQFGHGAASAATFQIDAENDLVVVMTRNKIGTNYDKYNGKFHDAIHAGIVKP